MNPEVHPLPDAPPSETPPSETPPSEARPAQRRVGRRLLLAVVVAGGLGALALAFTLGKSFFASDPAGPLVHPKGKRLEKPMVLAQGKRVTVWWDVLPANLRLAAADTDSNIHPADYTGPDACRQCHPRNYQAWSTHPHRWMNAPATAETVRGDFSGRTIAYRGGTATFESDASGKRMRLARDGVKR